MPMQTNSDKNGNEPIVRFENVNKAFGDLVVLRELNLQVAHARKSPLLAPAGLARRRFCVC
jgi:ABC-type transporter Mla maintaining outer membrane lipid asymmetry ATPase subunit MlaF